MRRARFAALFLTLATTAVAAPGAASATLDQQQTGYNASYAVLGPDIGSSIDRRVLVQTFTAGLTGDLDRVELRLSGGFGGVTEPLMIEIRDTTFEGAPGSVVLASAGFPAADVPACCTEGQPEVPVDFSVPPVVTKGTQYAIVAHTSGSGVFTWFGANEHFSPSVPDYAGGSAWFSRTSPPTSWEPEPADLVFKTYVTESFSFGGFASPIDEGVVNTAKAGATIPVRWHLEIPDGTPVSDPASFASITSQANNGACAGLPSDAVEAYVGGSGLQYLGDGDWQFNWKVPKSYAGQCRTLVLTLSSGATYTAGFQFK